jgi:hypothetical protein
VADGPEVAASAAEPAVAAAAGSKGAPVLAGGQASEKPVSFPPLDHQLSDEEEEVEQPQQPQPLQQQVALPHRQQLQLLPRQQPRASDPSAAASALGAGLRPASSGGTESRPVSAPAAASGGGDSSSGGGVPVGGLEAVALGSAAGPGGAPHPSDAALQGPQEYRITCITGSKLGAGTSARVRLQLVGTKATWVLPPLAQLLEDPSAAGGGSVPKPFQRSSCDVFAIIAPGDLGRLRTARLWLEGAGAVGLGGWLLARMEVWHIGTGRTWAFAPAAPGGWVPRGRNPDEGLELRAQALPPPSTVDAFAPLGPAEAGAAGEPYAAVSER